MHGHRLRGIQEDAQVNEWTCCFIGITFDQILELNAERCALSSGEAEYYGMVLGASVALGLKAVLKDFNIDCSIVLKSDAGAAIAISNRR